MRKTWISERGIGKTGALHWEEMRIWCVEQEAFESESCGAGCLHWKTPSLYLDLCCGTESTSTTQLCHYMSYVYITQKRKPGIYQ